MSRQKEAVGHARPSYIMAEANRASTGASQVLRRGKHLVAALDDLGAQQDLLDRAMTHALESPCSAALQAVERRTSELFEALSAVELERREGRSGE